MLLDQLSPRFAKAQLVRSDDERIAAEYIEYASPSRYGKMRGYFAPPEKAVGKQDFGAAFAFVKARPECTGKVGAVGFCYGGVAW